MIKKNLQITIFIFGFVPVLAGGYGVINGVNLFYNDTTTTIDLNNHFRYLSGLLLAIGLMFWSLIPKIETKSMQIQLLTTIVFIGGIARWSGTILHGEFNTAIAFALCMELIVTPLIWWWHARLYNK